jgi:hypothetical protein
MMSLSIYAIVSMIHNTQRIDGYVEEGEVWSATLPLRLTPTRLSRAGGVERGVSCYRVGNFTPYTHTFIQTASGQHLSTKTTPVTMNIFRFLGDLSHLAAFVILLHKIQTSRSCRGISFKTQALYLAVFCTRYLDLFTDYVSLYNSLMKLFFIGSTAYTLFLMKVKFRYVYFTGYQSQSTIHSLDRATRVRSERFGLFDTSPSNTVPSQPYPHNPHCPARRTN